MHNLSIDLNLYIRQTDHPNYYDKGKTPICQAPILHFF
ncbi:hypothetical protein [Staphylococcus phage vB_SauM-V1SA15]|nr:hypothetical protein [Staphylococcus phage vB_SauM-V1SA15]